MRDVRLPDFPFALPVYVWFRDLDAMGHVNNAVYLSYFEQARIGYWLSLVAPAQPTSPRDPRDVGFFVARVEVDFASPALLGEPLLVGCRISEVGTTSFVFDYRIVSRQSSIDSEVRLVASGRSVQVGWDWHEDRKIAITEDLRRRIEAIEGGALRVRER